MATDDDAAQLEDLLTKEVYAQFGLAYYSSECVFRALVLVLAAGGIATTGPRLDEGLRDRARGTMGPLVQEAKSKLPAALHASLDWCLESRNFLAHRFWHDRIHQLYDTQGKTDLIGELEGMTEMFRSIYASLDTISTSALAAAGVTEQMIADRMAAVALEDVPPLPTRAAPKVGSRIQIRAAWTEGTMTSAHALVLEDSEGLYWQLCDAGLGWCYRDGPRANWTPCDVVNKHLPAAVEARPKGAEPWNFDLSFSTGARLIVRRARDADVFHWTIKSAQA